MSNFLEVDPKILEKNFLLNNDDPSDDSDIFEKLLKSTENSSNENTPWKFAKPVPGCCIKTTDDKREKIFVNLCQLDDIPEPKELTESELLELWQSEDSSDYRIPISIQDPHTELDNSGKPATVYDVAVNTNFFKKIQKNTIFRSFLLQVVFEGLENKYDISLEKEGFKILQNRKCLGELRPHRIRVHKGPYVPPKRLIEELPSSEKVPPADSASVETNKNVSSVPHYRFYENTHTKSLIGEFYLPKIIASKDVVLDVGEDRLVIESQKCRYLTDVFLPMTVDENEVTAKFNRKTKILVVNMPIAIAT